MRNYWELIDEIMSYMDVAFRVETDKEKAVDEVADFVRRETNAACSEEVSEFLKKKIKEIDIEKMKYDPRDLYFEFYEFLENVLPSCMK